MASAFSVALSSAGLSASSTGMRSARTFWISAYCTELSWQIVWPPATGPGAWPGMQYGGAALAEVISETYRSPNSVLGSSWAT